LGRRYVIDFSRNFIVDKDIDLEQLARELNCLGRGKSSGGMITPT
jgi:hypothetical protein